MQDLGFDEIAMSGDIHDIENKQTYLVELLLENFKCTTRARTIIPNNLKTLLCSSSRESGYPMIAMVWVRGYLEW